MEKRCIGKEHKRAIPFNKIYALFVAEVHSISTHRTLSSAAVQPDIVNASLGTVAHYPFSVSGRGHDQRTFDGRFDVLNADETPFALQFTRSWVYGNHVITPVTHFTEKHATEILRIAGKTHEGNASQSEEIVHFSDGGRHGSRPPSESIQEIFKTRTT